MSSIKSQLADANLSEDAHEAILQLAGRLDALEGKKEPAPVAEAYPAAEYAAGKPVDAPKVD